MASIATFPSPREPLSDLAPPDDRRLAATVLVVDDDHGVTALFSRLLTTSGCTVRASRARRYQSCAMRMRPFEKWAKRASLRR